MSPSSSGANCQLCLLEGDCVGLLWPIPKSRTRKSSAFFCGSVDRFGCVTLQGDVLSRVLQSNFTRASRNAFAITLKDDSAIASAPSIGDSRMPNTGYSAPAAIGTPAAL